MLSPEMHDFLRENLASSVKENQPWRLIGNASPIARMLVPDIVKHGVNPKDNPDRDKIEGGTLLLRAGKWKDVGWLRRGILPQ